MEKTNLPLAIEKNNTIQPRRRWYECSFYISPRRVGLNSCLITCHVFKWTNKQKKKSSIKCVINHIEKKSICVSKLSARQRQKKKHTASIQDDFFFCTHEWKYAQKKELTLLKEITHMPSNVIAFHIDVAMAIFPTQSKTLFFFIILLSSVPIRFITFLSIFIHCLFSKLLPRARSCIFFFVYLSIHDSTVHVLFYFIGYQLVEEERKKCNVNRIQVTFFISR